MPEIIEVKAYSVDLPLKNPFETAKGRKTTSPFVAVELQVSGGVSGFGSATPVKYVTDEDIDSVLQTVEECRSELIGSNPCSYRSISQTIAEALPDAHSARSAIETAVLDAYCKLHGMPMYHFFGGAVPHVETDITIPIVSPDTARGLAEEAATQGFKFLKIKVSGADTEADFARVIAVGEGAPNCGIRIDANQGFTAAGAVKFITNLEHAHVKLDMVEQPVDRDDLDGLRYVTMHSKVPVFADESVVTPRDALRLILLDAVDGINIKLMKSGILGALDIISLCTAARKELMLGCMVESGVGIATAVHLACGTGAFSRLDLDAHLLIAEQPCPGGFRAEGALLMPDTGTPGHGAAMLCHD